MKYHPMKIYFSNFAETSTLHGLQNVSITRSGLIRRIFWLCLVLFMVAVFVVVVVKQHVKYFSYPKSTKIELREQRPLNFPSVTICNHNIYRKSVVARHPPFADILKRSFGDGTFNISNMYLESQNLVNITKVAMESIQPLDEMLNICVFRGKAFNCSDYFTLMVTPFGPCYTFNSYDHVLRKGSFESYSTGSAQGLYLRMNVNQPEYFFGPSNSAGFKITLHDPFAFPDINSESFLVRPGYETYVSFNLMKTESLPEPYEAASCTEEQKQLKYYKTYSKLDCLYDCMGEYLIENCGCVHNYIIPDFSTYCNSTQAVACLPYGERFYTDGIIGTCDCMELCSRNVYKASISSAFFPAEHILSSLEKVGLNESYLRQNVVDLRIYFEQLNYNYIKEIPSYPIGEFWADLGGQFGLFLGASILTVLEFMDFTGRLLFSAKRSAVTGKKPSTLTHSKSKENIQT